MGKPDHFDLLFDISKLTELVTGSADIESYMQLSVELLAQHFNAQVCSIYLYSEHSGNLILKATKGLKKEAVNQIQMKPGEGLIGHSFKDLSIIREGNASQNTKFKYFAEAGEETFNSFLCVPIKRGIEKIGVLAVQHADMDYFDVSDERAIRSVAIQLAGSMENARLLLALSQDTEKKSISESLQFIKGKAAAGGVAMGKPIILKKKQHTILYDPNNQDQIFTKEDFKTAIEKTTLELKDLQKEFAKRLPESASLIFTAHFMILKDKNFTGEMEKLIDNGLRPDEAVRKVAAKYISIFSSSPHTYMQEKAQDVEDLSIRILNNFKTSDQDSPFEKGHIAIARQVYPSDILKFVSAGVQGIILASGGATSHVSILSRSLQIPLIITEHKGVLSLPDNTMILMDGELGNIYINPDKETISLFQAKEEAARKTDPAAMAEQTRTRDNEKVDLLSNINLLSEVNLAKQLKAQGIGLYRTEFPFLIRATFPSETEQYIIYKKLFDSMEDKVITIRTLDAGGEKTLAYSDSPTEANPELGMRSIRFSLKYKDVFTNQIRAILRAAADRKNIRLMFPLISSIDEFLEAKAVVHDSIVDLDKEGLEFNRNVPIGLMVELPSVVEIIDEFARQADFFSIGTNDFIQYMMAADRSNKMVADHYVPWHPAVNRSLKKIVAAAQTHSIDVAVCGEMAHESEHIPFLLGVGIRSLSVDPQFLPSVQRTVQNLKIKDAEQFSKEIINQTTIIGVRKIVKTWKPKWQSS